MVNKEDQRLGRIHCTQKTRQSELAGGVGTDSDYGIGEAAAVGGGHCRNVLLRRVEDTVLIATDEKNDRWLITATEVVPSR